MMTKKISSRLRAEKRRGDLPCVVLDTPVLKCMDLARHCVVKSEQKFDQIILSSSLLSVKPHKHSSR